MRQTRILIIDEEIAILKLLQANLHSEGYATFTARNGEEAILLMEQEMPDLVILGIMLPDISGFEICRRFREWSAVPIVMLGSRDDDEDRVKCFDLGADDCITKPFSVAEVLARIRAVLRRTGNSVPRTTSFRSGCFDINFAQHRVTVKGNEIKLTPTEYHLLQELVLNAGRVLTYAHLLNRVWGPEYREEKEYVHVFANRLRAKLEQEPSRPEYIVNVPSIGYRFHDACQVSADSLAGFR